MFEKRSSCSQSTQHARICYSFYEGHRHLKCARCQNRDWRENKACFISTYILWYRLVASYLFLFLTWSAAAAVAVANSRNNNNIEGDGSSMKAARSVCCTKQTNIKHQNQSTKKTRARHMTKLTNKNVFSLDFDDVIMA